MNPYKNHTVFGCHGNKNSQKKLCLCKKFGYQIIILWCFEKDIKTLFFQNIWKAYLEWNTSALGMEYPK